MYPRNMLVLLVGATGSLGLWMIDSFTKRGHQVRVLARNPSKIDAARFQKLESFVQSTSYDDIPALDKACAGVDAVVCVYNGAPILQLDGQLLLLRAAERAGVKRFLTSSFNGDWRDMKLGEQYSYDGMLSFEAQAQKTSSINPHYVFCGIIAEVMLVSKDTMNFSTENHGPWNPTEKKLEIWGTGDEPWQWTTEKDAAEFAAEIILRDDAEEGGYWCVCSGTNSLREIGQVYEQVRGVPVGTVTLGSVEDLRALAFKKRSNTPINNFWSYIGLFYYLNLSNGRWMMKELDNEKLGVKPTTLAQFLEENPQI